MNQYLPATRAGADVQVQGPTQYLTFMSGAEVYAIAILGIKEIIEYSGTTAVPMMPDCIRGVINLRGAVVPVMDLAARFGKPNSEVTKRTSIVIVETLHRGVPLVLGVMVDVVHAVLEIDRRDIEPAPVFGARVRSELIAGIGKVNGRFVILLAIDAVLDSVEMHGAAGVDTHAVLADVALIAG